MLFGRYATFCALAGVDPTDQRAAATGLPPIDSIDMTEVLIGGIEFNYRHHT